MRIDLPAEQMARYKSPSQRARVATESWAEANLFCPSCPSPWLESFKPNTPASDFICPRCEERFQLKSSRSPFETRIQDAAYSSMVKALQSDEVPSIFALHYDPEKWRVSNLILIPRFAYSLKDIHKRAPLSSSARRHDWVGCDILLHAIPQRARIPVILSGVPIAPRAVRSEFQRLSPLQSVRAKLRGWTLDVLLIIDSLGKAEFELSEIYAHEQKLRALHFRNRHVQPKIRQQLQRLRDLGFLRFVRRGLYRLT